MSMHTYQQFETHANDRLDSLRQDARGLRLAREQQASSRIDLRWPHPLRPARWLAVIRSSLAALSRSLTHST